MMRFKKSKHFAVNDHQRQQILPRKRRFLSTANFGIRHTRENLMNNLNKILLSFAIVGVAGCAALEESILQSYERYPDAQVCSIYGAHINNSLEINRNRAKKLRSIIDSRGLFNAVDLRHFRRRNLAIGMSPCGVSAALRQVPGYVNVSVTSTGKVSQLVFRRGSVGSHYVYLNEKGVVEAFQLSQ